jgi:hypothetical protein
METGFSPVPPPVSKPPGQGKGKREMQHAGCPFMHRDVASSRPRHTALRSCDFRAGTEVLGQTTAWITPNAVAPSRRLRGYSTQSINHSCRFSAWLALISLRAAAGRGWGLRRSSYAPGLCNFAEREERGLEPNLLLFCGSGVPRARNWSFQSQL